MIGFLGEFEATLDAKGRFLFPAVSRNNCRKKKMPTFVINRGFEKCLSLYPLKSWEPLFADISKLNDFDPKVREFQTVFSERCHNVEPDSAGRC